MTHRKNRMKISVGLLTIAFVLIFAGVAAFAQSRTDPALFATARKALPPDLSTNAITKALDAGLWNSNRTALAISISRLPKPTVIFVFLKQASGEYLASDVSAVEGGNFGVLGVSGRNGYDRFETMPVEWLHRDDGRANNS